MPTNVGLTTVSTTATLSGATANAVFAPGSYVARQYIILNATGGVSGTYNPTVATNNANLHATLGYDPVYLNVQLAYVSPTRPQPNQQNVANPLSKILMAFAALSPAGLTVASDELGTGAIQSSIRADELFLNLLLDPTASQSRRRHCAGRRSIAICGRGRSLRLKSNG